MERVIFERKVVARRYRVEWLGRYGWNRSSQGFRTRLGAMVDAIIWASNGYAARVIDTEAVS